MLFRVPPTTVIFSLQSPRHALLTWREDPGRHPRLGRGCSCRAQTLQEMGGTQQGWHFGQRLELAVHNG
ncbi:hypothetical protein COOONC_07590 [Cooperia oncophora]